MRQAAAVASSPAAPSDSAQSPAPEAAGPDDLARSAGRGGLAVAFAKGWFILTGFVHQTVLPHLIGLGGYGAFATCQAIANIPNNVIVASSIQAVSRGVASAPPGHEAAAARKALRIHAGLAPLFALAFFLLAPAVAGLQRAPHLDGPLRVFAVIVLVYGLYAPLVGVLNGRRRFLAQASLDITSATLRTALVLGVAWLAHSRGHGVLGAALGLALAALFVLPVALAVVRPKGLLARSPGSVRPHLGLLLPLALTQLCLNLLMQADISLLRPLAMRAGGASGLEGELLRTATDELVGAYRAAQLFAFLPYQLLIAIGFVLFPMLARKKAENDAAAVRLYTRTGIRTGLLVGGLMVACTAGLSPHLLRFAFPEEAALLGGDALRILALGQGAFAIFGLETTALASLGKERWSAAITALAAGLVALFCFLLVPGTGFGPSLLVRTALATSLALGLAALAGAVLLVRVAGAFTAPASLLRVGLALGAAILVGSQLPWMGRVVFVGEVGIVLVVYLAVLGLSRELGRSDLAVVRGLLGRRAPAR